ncbi:hypothetical protein MMC26_001216 [Xylographa opegraphella]|nr:hypothetical protein [Xylographa opegraphella]
MEDAPPHQGPETETTTLMDSWGIDLTANDMITVTDTSANTDFVSPADVPMTMISVEEGPGAETPIEMAEDNGSCLIPDFEEKTTESNTCMDMATEATASFFSAPENEVTITKTVTHMIEPEPIPTTENPQVSCPTESSTSLDQKAAVMTQQDDTTMDEKPAAPIEENAWLVQAPMIDTSNATARMTGEYGPAQSSQAGSTSTEMSTTDAMDQTTEDLASRSEEIPISNCGLSELDQATSAHQTVEQPGKHIALRSTVRSIATPIPFAQRRGAPSKASKLSSTLIQPALQPSLADNTVATLPASLIKEQDSSSPQLTASHPGKSMATSLSKPVTKPKPQLGPARIPKKPVDPFIRKKPARKTQDGAGTQVKPRAKTASTSPENPLIRKVPEDAISTKRNQSHSGGQEVHGPVESTSSRNDQLRETPKQNSLPVADSKAGEDDIESKRVRKSLLPTHSITSDSKNEGPGSACQVTDAPALFEDRAMEAARAWTPLQDLTEEQVIKQVNDWLVTDTQFFRKVDECTMTKNFGAFAGFDFEKLLKQCYWTTTWLNEQNMGGNNAVLFEKTQLRRTADYVQKLCAAFMEGKVKNRKDRGKSDGDRIEFVTMIDGMECRGYRPLTKEEKRARDGDLDSEKAVDVENIKALTKWAESVLVLGDTTHT